MVKNGNTATIQLRIKWTNLKADATKWEDADVPQTRFPSALACGQASSAGEPVTTATEVTEQNDDERVRLAGLRLWL
jgi:hypothetical protein